MNKPSIERSVCITTKISLFTNFFQQKNLFEIYDYFMIYLFLKKLRFVTFSLLSPEMKNKKKQILFSQKILKF